MTVDTDRAGAGQPVDDCPDQPLLRQVRTFVGDFLSDVRDDLGGTLGLMLLGGVLEGIGLLVLVPLAGLIVAGDGWWQTTAASLFAIVGVTTPFARITVLLAVFVLVMVARAGVLLLRDRRMAALVTGFIERRRVALIRALAGARWQDVATLRHSRVTAAVGTDVQRLSAATHYLLQATVAAVMLTAQWLLTLLIAPSLAFFVLALIAVGGVMSVSSLRRVGGIGSAVIESQARMMDASGQFLAGLKVAIAQDAQGSFVRDFEEGARSLSRQHIAFEHRQSRLRIGTASVSALAGASVLLLGTWAAVPVASLLVAVVAMARMSAPASQIQQAAQQIAHLLPAHTGIVALIRDLGSAPLVTDRTRHVPLPVGTIAFHGVTFRHADGGGVEALDLSLDPGEIVGVVGVSGAGKTTFVDLLAGLLEPAAGHITVGDLPLSRDNVARYRRSVAYVGQDGFLVHDTIRRNLTLGMEDVDDASLWSALTLVGAEPLVRGLEAGLDTVVAERGARLSGGERQRIALARALLRQPTLIILDEATNAIDIAGERTILAGIAADVGRPTLVIVAHRVETLEPCTRLLRFAQGRLVQDSALH